MKDNKKDFTEEEIKKFPRQNVSVDQFIRIALKFKMIVDGEQEAFRKHVLNMPHGSFLCVRFNEEIGKGKRLHLQRIFMKSFSMKYHAKGTKGKGSGYKGSELLISNCPMPKGSPIE